MLCQNTAAFPQDEPSSLVDLPASTSFLKLDLNETVTYPHHQETEFIFYWINSKSLVRKQWMGWKLSCKMHYIRALEYRNWQVTINTLTDVKTVTIAYRGIKIYIFFYSLNFWDIALLWKGWFRLHLETRADDVKILLLLFGGPIKSTAWF